MILGVGVDAVDIERIERMHATHGDRLLTRLFTEDELAYLSTKTFPAQHMAVRLAAKEAAYKALSGNDDARAIGWREIEVLSRRSDGAPELRLHGRASNRFAELRGTSIHVSLSHSQATAVAVVIVEGL
jgi:holo-[acyl-carrier protein] synthase